MSPSRVVVAFSIMACAAVIGMAAGAGARSIPHPGPPSPQRDLAEEWVRHINSGDQRDACALQAVGEVNGRPCSELPTRQVLHCPKNSVVRKPKPSDVLRAYEQVGSVTEEAEGRAFAVLRSQRKKSRVRGALGLELRDGRWQVTYLRQGDKTYAPAGDVWMTDAWRKLWYPPRCSPRT